MNSHKKPNEILDLSLSHSLKNWVNRKNLPAQGRNRLLAAAAQQEIPSFQHKLAKFAFRWNSRFQGDYDQLQPRPIYGYGFENFDLLVTRMVFL